MKLTVEFDLEAWRMKSWWRRLRCRVGGHPEFVAPTRSYWDIFYPYDPRPRCTRCHAVDPSAPELARKATTFTFARAQSDAIKSDIVQMSEDAAREPYRFEEQP